MPLQRRRDIVMAGVALSLSVTANLIFAVPAAALAGIALYLFAKRPPLAAVKKRPARKVERPAWLWFTAPIAAIALVFLVLAPVENMKTERRFHRRRDHLRESSQSGFGFLGALGAVAIAVLGRCIPRLNRLRNRAIDHNRRTVGGNLAPQRRHVMAGGTIVLSAVAILLLHLVWAGPIRPIARVSTSCR